MADEPRLDNSSGVLTSMPHPLYPDGYTETLEYRAVDTEMADGTISTDLIVMGAKRRFVLRWHMLTDAQKTTLTTLWGGLSDGTARTFEPPFTTTTYEVTRDAAFYDLRFDSHMTASGLRWSTELRLREV